MTPLLDMLGELAEFETNLRREPQLEGIAWAKARGIYKGRPASKDAVRVRKLKAQGLGAHRDRRGPQDRPRIGLPGIGGVLPEKCPASCALPGAGLTRIACGGWMGVCATPSNEQDAHLEGAE
jgi:hypothetical protein